MKKLILFITLAITIPALGQHYQPLVASGKLWSTGFIVGYPPYSQHTEFVKFEGDTLVNGTAYKKIMITQDSLLTGWEFWSLIREDELHRVYQYNTWQGEEFLLYDFDVEVGDTIFVNQSPSGLLLDSVYTTVMENGELRTAYRWLDMNIPTGYPPLFETWIEGVGSFLGVLQSGMSTAVGGYSYSLCMHENDTLVYQREGNNSCTVITSVPEPEPSPEITISQIGESGRFRISISHTDPSSFELMVFDMTGKPLCSKPFGQVPETVIDLSTRPGGLYILHLRSDRYSVTRKFLKG